MPKKFHIMIQLSPKLSPKQSPLLRIATTGSPNTIRPKSSPLQKARARAASDDSSSTSLESFSLDGTAADETEDEEDSLTGIMDGLKQQMAQIESSASQLNGRVKDIYKRAKEEEVRWMDDPMIPRAEFGDWMKAHGLAANPNLRAFLDACFTAAISMDLTTRMLTFSKEDAALLWEGKEVLTIFDVIAALPRFFE